LRGKKRHGFPPQKRREWSLCTTMGEKNGNPRRNHPLLNRLLGICGGWRQHLHYLAKKRGGDRTIPIGKGGSLQGDRHPPTVEKLKKQCGNYYHAPQKKAACAAREKGEEDRKKGSQQSNTRGEEKEIGKGSPRASKNEWGESACRREEKEPSPAGEVRGGGGGRPEREEDSRGEEEPWGED